MGNEWPILYETNICGGKPPFGRVSSFEEANRKIYTMSQNCLAIEKVTKNMMGLPIYLNNNMNAKYLGGIRGKINLLIFSLLFMYVFIFYPNRNNRVKVYCK